jgi:hypothetical protein
VSRKAFVFEGAAMHPVYPIRILSQRAKRLRSRAQHFIPFALGALLLLAAGLKCHQLATEPVAEMDLWTSRWFLIALSNYELLLGLWLLAGFWPRASRAVALISFAGFATIAFRKALIGEASCGCFGKIPVDPRYTLVLDVAAIFALVAWRRAADASRSTLLSPQRERGQSEGGIGRRRVLRYIGVALVMLLLAGAGFVLGTYSPSAFDAEGNLIESSTIVLLQPEKWVGRRLPLLKYIDIGDELARDHWLVVLYHHDCPKCQEAFPRYESMARESASMRVALVAVPPYGDPTSTPVAPGSPCRLGVLKATKRWFVTTPTELIVHDGTVMPETAERVAYTGS